MGGWLSKNEPVIQTFSLSFPGSVGTALDANWTMMQSRLNLIVELTQTPRDVQLDGGGAALEPFTRIIHPRFALNALTVPASKRRVRFSLIANNIASSAATGLLVTDPAIYTNPTTDPHSGGYGSIYADRNNSRIVSQWGGGTITVPQLFHSPGLDKFMFGLEILGGDVNFYRYGYGSPDATTPQQIFDAQFDLMGTVPYSTPDIATLFLGAFYGNAGDWTSAFQLDVLQEVSSLCVNEQADFNPVWTLPAQ